LGDFNGDGLSDIASAYGGNVYMKLSTGSGFTSQTWTVPAAWGEAGYTWLGDFNGDGLSDIASAKFGNVYMHLSTGKGFTSQTWTVPNAWGGAGYTWLGDFNGDGLSDIASAYGGNVYMKLSTGSGFTSQTWTVPAAWGEAGYTWLGDFNGDGLSDIASAKFGNVYVHLTSSPLTDLMATIGSSAYSTVVYKSLGSNSVYNTYPYSGIIPISNVASSVETDNGIGGRNVTNYHYEGAKTHRLGRGFLGFEKVTAATTGQNNVTAITETNYYQMSQAGLTYALPFAQRDFWRNGMVESEITKIDGVVQSTTTNTWAHRASDMNQVIPYLASSTTIEREPSSGQIVATKISTTDSIDQYGNVTQTTDKVFEGQYDVGNNYISVSKSEYLLPSNFPTVWLPSQVKKQTVNRTIPYDIGNATKPENRSSTNTVEYEYYSNGQLWKEKIEPLDTKLWLTKTYEYDPVYGHVRKATTTGAGVTQARWLQTDINYNFSPSQYEVTTTNALGHVERRYVAKATGATLAQIGPNGIVGVNGYTTEWVYDGWGRKVEERRADGNVSTWNYIDCAGNYTCEQGEMFFVKAENPGAPWVTVYYDTLGSEVRSLRPSFNYSSTGTTIVSRKQYDSLGRELGSSDAHFSNASAHWSCNEYDNYGRLITRSVPTTIKCSDLTYLDPLVSFEYWGLETRETKHNDGSSGPQTTVQRKNPIGQLVAVQDAMSNPETKYFYNSQGSLVLVEDAKGNQIKTSYDNRGRKVAMDDPDMGHWEYAYNAIGELTSQQNAKLQIVSMTYDALGRMTRRNEPDGSFSSWSYDSGYKAIGKLVSSQNSQSGFSRSIAYDDFGRLKTGTTNILFSPYQMDTAYDQYGRVSTVTYPIRATGDRFVVLNCYDESGYLKEVRQPGVCFSGTGHLWKANAVNASGQVTSETLGNGMNTLRVYDGVWGRLTDITTGSGSTVQMSSFVYDRLGNLAERRWMGTDISGQNQVETFGYDSLNRLTSANLVGIKTTNYSYDAIGNILSKSDFGNDYYYGNDGVRPHAVRNVYNNGVLKASYAYDANGFMTAGNGRTIQPTWFGQPYEMTKGANFSRFGYDIENNRVVQTTEKGFTVYLNPRIDTGSTYEKTTQSGVVTHKHYLYASSGVIGVFEAMESATTGASQGTKTKYFHKDHLGSVEVVTDQNKSVLARYSYDAFGKNRDSNLGGFLTDTSSILQVTPHRFTAHEHMDNMGIIHMNGRTYDPELGRFMSADPNIDGAANPQGYNRFSYLQNNPLNAIDPSGYKKFWKKKWFKKLAFVAIAAVAIYAGGAYILANGFTSSVMIGAGVGAAIGGYAGYQADGISGMWKGAIVGAAIGGLTGAAGANLSAGYGAVTSGAVQGMFSGFGSGVALGYQGGKGSFNSIVDTSLAGAAVGAAVGGAIGYANKWLSSGKWPSGPSESFAPRGNGEWTVSINGVRDEIIHAGITQLYNSLGQQLTTNLVTAYVVTHQQDVEGEIKKKKSGEVNAGCKLDGNDNLDRCSVSAS
jgi:RHS repeat-associated protein